jgi:hypothetical protein
MRHRQSNIQKANTNNGDRMIDSYTFGKIIIDGKTYTNDLIIFPDHVQDDWWRAKVHELGPEDIKDILEHKPEVLVVGTGAHGCMVITADGMDLIKENSIKLLVQPTPDACKTYNKYHKEKKTIAALHLTC